MVVVLTNASQEELQIQDLGVRLPAGGSTNLNAIPIPKILLSTDLSAAMGNGSCTATFDSASVIYATLIEKLSGLSRSEHENLRTLKHPISETAYFEVVKNAGLTQYIRYWTDSGKTVKIYEEEIVRSAGKTSQIIRREYDVAGTLSKTETQTITRSNGIVSNISIAVS